MAGSSKGRKPIYLRIAQELEARIAAGFLDEPRSMASMASVWDVSTRTMGKAVHLLVDKGIVRCMKGRKISRAGSGGSSHAPQSQRNFYGMLRNRILAGTYRSGRPLPKVNYFVITDRVSPNTVSAVCARLAHENLIHKSGKQWIVGRPSSHHTVPTAGAAGRRPTVLLLFNYGMEWEPFFSTPWNVPFSGTFTTELQHYGWMTSLGFMVMSTWNRRGTAGPPIPVGTEQILLFAKSLGDRYQGTLAYFGIDRYDTAAECVGALLGLDKPVMLFDHSDRYGDFGAEVTGKRASPFYRFHFDERRGIQLALQTLADHGHRRIGLPVHSSPQADWIPRRVELILEIARTIAPSLAVITSEQHETFWQYDQGFNLALYSRHLMSALQPAEKDHETVRKRPSLASLLRAHTPSLTTLLDKGITALLCLNDAMAREIYLWATYTGLRVPGDISMISFDNNAACQNFPVTTIDFGFARLGYLAAHKLIGDIPVKADKKGNIPGPCTIVDRGSLAHCAR